MPRACLHQPCPCLRLWRGGLARRAVSGPGTCWRTPLAEVLAADRLDAARTMDVIAPVAAGQQPRIRPGVVHRDVKPANPLISRAGQVKITDFGIATLMWSAPVTSSGTLVGTPAYLAPERVTGASATPESGLYSLGDVGYECLAGVSPFRGSAVEVAEAHPRCSFPPLPANVPADVAALITALTAKDPGNRPNKARETSERAAGLYAASAGGIAPYGTSQEAAATDRRD